MIGKDETPIDAGEIENAGETIEVMAWLTNISLPKHILHIAINNKEVVANQNDGSITIGKHMAVYNDWTNPALIYTFLEVVEANQLRALDGSANAGKGIAFNDLSKTTYRNKLNAPTKAVTALGRLESLGKGFQFKLNCPKETDKGKVIKIGLYNTSVSNPWKD